MNTNNQANEEKPKLTQKQRELMKKIAVFSLMGIICAGCIWFIFAPSSDEKAKQDAQAGFNADIPLPKEEGLIGDKRDAYEQEQMKQKQSEKMRSLQDFSSMLDDNHPAPADDLALITDEAAPKTGGGYASQSRGQSSIQNSAHAYRDMNRTLGSFYEAPREDPEKECLKQELEELKMRMDESETRKKPVDEQMALMEKSFQMAAKYMPGTAGTTGTPAANAAGPATASNPVSRQAGGYTRQQGADANRFIIATRNERRGVYRNLQPAPQYGICYRSRRNGNRNKKHHFRLCA